VFTAGSSEQVARNSRGSCRDGQAEGFESILAKPFAFGFRIAAPFIANSSRLRL
jgi:hypothetical protein